MRKQSGKRIGMVAFTVACLLMLSIPGLGALTGPGNQQSIYVADAGVIATTWESIGVMPGNVTLEDGLAVITETNPEAGGAWGGVSSPFISINFSRGPVVIIDMNRSDPKWALKLYVEGGERWGEVYGTWGFYVQGDNSMVGKIDLDLVQQVKLIEKVDLAGVENAQLWMIPCGKEGAKVWVRSIELLYQEPGGPEKPQPGPIDRVELMPNIPSPFKMRDWEQVTRDYVAFVFDLDKKGEYLPLISLDEFRDEFRLRSFVGNLRGYEGEAINCMAAVVSASLVEINMTNYKGRNWVRMVESWYNDRIGIYVNNIGGGAGSDWWYDILPNILFYQLAYYYPDVGNFQNQTRTVADSWYNACVALGGSVDPWNIPNFNYTAFNFNTMKPVFLGWVQPDAAAGIAWLEYIAWLKWGDPKYLIATDWCLQYLDNITFNPLYEVVLPYGAYIAARMNAELGRNYDIHKIINWCFEPSYVRTGWGVIADNWGGYDCHGLHGSITDDGGYAFAMGTFENVGALVPIVRYDPRFARAIGKYVLNAANAARLFYANALPDDHQSSADWGKTNDLNYCIAYEGLRRYWEGKSPYATGDAIRSGWAQTDFGLYGSSHVGIFGGIINPTNDEKILQLDCLVTDYYHDTAYPTYLYYNPYDIEKTVEINVGPGAKDLYDATTDNFLATNVSGLASFTLPADSAALVVVAPANGTISYDGNKKLINGVVVDYFPLTRTFNAGTWGGVTYYVTTFSNSIIAGFNFSRQDMEIRFNVSGPSGTVGFCNVTIPKNLLNANETHPWEVYLNGDQINYTKAENTTHTFIYFNYTHSPHMVRIRGTWVIPELPAAMIPPLLLIIAVVGGAAAIAVIAFVLLRRRKSNSQAFACSRCFLMHSLYSPKGGI